MSSEKSKSSIEYAIQKIENKFDNCSSEKVLNECKQELLMYRRIVGSMMQEDNLSGTKDEIESKLSYCQNLMNKIQLLITNIDMALKSARENS